jgi:hypothetical protein
VRVTPTPDEEDEWQWRVALARAKADADADAEALMMEETRPDAHEITAKPVALRSRGTGAPPSIGSASDHERTRRDIMACAPEFGDDETTRTERSVTAPIDRDTLVDAKLPAARTGVGTPPPLASGAPESAATPLPRLSAILKTRR